MEHDLAFIHSEIDSLSWHLNRNRGLLDRLDNEIERGRWVHPETTEALRLTSDATCLRLMAAALELRRDKLVGNMSRMEAAE